MCDITFRPAHLYKNSPSTAALLLRRRLGLRLVRRGSRRRTRTLLGLGRWRARRLLLVLLRVVVLEQVVVVLHLLVLAVVAREELAALLGARALAVLVLLGHDGRCEAARQADDAEPAGGAEGEA